MGLTAKDSGGSGGDFEPVEEGIHQGICIWVYDLGTHFQEKWGTNVHKCLIGWELPELRIEIEKDGEKQDLPRMVSQRYTLSLHEKSIMRRDLQTWRGKKFTGKELQGFDISKLLGVGCQIQIIHNDVGDKTYANVSSVLPLPKGAEKLKPENDLKFFSFEDGTPPPEGTPKWVLDIIEDSNEYKGQDEPQAPDLGSADQDDDIPF